ncbi:putative Zn-dependent hydrolase of beta-lactamase fold protein (plasmid) [Cylindrospermum stagnale PCC 7417]|uniref:Putative Zn-dependent hydrolase of beta-lactamase fold protein n=1 Tax=Cylindrospermum stagnale PCC 7417 TaxID=56107 RepID=K9X6X9_9NOST|nr:MBL fold metallo-hydrolase [Cylindrospermum stagnale]AFZ28248.1 putative Zn-dependent hydrolase of beta-lactamase fold protein [Cylindrospermum stagnale PCC 7417]
MKNQQLYLKHNVVVEPLINQWYAWPYLISPATAAMFIAHSHLKIMQSFVSTPQVHISALKNPAMLGGPFINYDTSRVDEIKALMDKMIKEQAHMLELAEAIKTLDKMLTNEATGYSLEPVYQKIPEVLKGYVELIYDLNNHPSIRFIEGLLYQSLYYNQSAQSIALYLINPDKRNFVFSTPRLEDDSCLHLSIPFSCKVIDELFKMKDVPCLLSSIEEKLNIKTKDYELFTSLFTQEEPHKSTEYIGDDVRIRYFGHACLLIESKGISILCDPIISYKCDTGINRYTYADLPDCIDYILVTHNHQDHCMFETLLQLRHKTKNVIVPKNNGGGLADPSLKLVLQNIGFDKEKVREIDEMETMEIAGGMIIGLPFFGEHGDLNIRTKIAYVIRLQGRIICIAADSNNLQPKVYEYIHNFLGNDVDVLFLGMECDGGPLTWLYGSLLTQPLPRKMDQSRRANGSNYEKAIDLVKQLNPKEVYVYAMGQEPWLTFLTSIQYTEDSRPIIDSNKLVETCTAQGIIAERLFGQKELFLK